MKHNRKKSRPPGPKASHNTKHGIPVVSAGTSPSVSNDTEPRTEHRWPPLWLVILLGVLFYWGQLYLDSNAAGFDPRVHEPFQSFAQLDALQPKDEAELLLAKGRILFETKCGICHQATGLGLPGQFPPLAGSEWVNTPGPGRIIRIAFNGLRDPIEVKGQIWNGNMPPGLTTDLKPEELAALVSYVRRSWGNNAPIVKPEQAKAIMEKVADHAQWTAEELKAVPEVE